MNVPLKADDVRRLASKYDMAPKVTPLTDEEIERLRSKKHTQSYKARKEAKL